MPENIGEGRASFFRGLRRRLLIGTLCIVGTLVLLEVGLRVYYAIHPKSPARGVAKPDYSYELVCPDDSGRISQAEGWIKLVYNPYVIYKNLPHQHTELYNINSLGLRGDEVASDKSEDLYRIIVTGNSATFGVGASNDRGTLPYLLQQTLNERGAYPKRVEVLNAGVIGYLTSQELAYLQMELVDLRPDLIIAYNGYTDFISPASRTLGCTKPLENPQHIIYQSLFYDVERTLIDHINEQHMSLSARALDILAAVAMRTCVGRFLQEKLWSTAPGRTNAAKSHSAVGAATGDVPSDCTQAIVSNYEWHVRRISELSVDWGVKLLWVVQPESGWKSQRSPEEDAARQRMLAANPWYDALLAEVYPSFLQAARQAATDHGVEFLDLSRVFDAHPDTLFADLAHLNDAGNAVVARALADHLAGGEPHDQR